MKLFLKCPCGAETAIDDNDGLAQYSDEVTATDTSEMVAKTMKSISFVRPAVPSSEVFALQWMAHHRMCLPAWRGLLEGPVETTVDGRKKVDGGPTKH